MKRSITYLIVLTLFIFTGVQAQKFSFTAIPDWVKSVDIPTESSISKYDITSGFYLKLVDYQVSLEENAFFTHEVRNVISYGGITSASQLLISYDTSYQHLEVHHLFIWRKDKKIDRTKELKLEIMNNEYNLHNGIYTGDITAYANLEDIRKDDLIDFAYTLVGKNPIFDDDKFLFVPLASMNPIDLFTLRVLYPKEKEYNYECVDCDSLKITDTVIGNYRQIGIHYPNLKPIKLEDNMPSWSIPFQLFTLSSHKSWKDVNAWAQSVFSLPDKPKLDDVLEEVLTGDETTEQKIFKLINYVQDDIRYMGIESGIGSIKPFAPEQVVKQRFGDCKDKSLLLVWLLKNIGIEKAYPALVNSVTQSKVDKYLVSNQIFDHCIVTFEYDNETYWVDPTIAMQGGDFKYLYTPDYGKALIIGQAADTLQLMYVKNEAGMTKYSDEFTFRSFTEPAQLKITSERNGFEADIRRLGMEYYSINDITELVGNELKLQFPAVNKTSEVIINDDMDSNTFTMTYNYEIDGMWKDGDKGTAEAAKGLWLYRFEPRTIYNYLKTSVCEERVYDYELAFPQNVHYRVVLNFPKDLLATDSFKTYDNEAFYFEEKVEQLNSHSLQVDYRFMTKRNCIEAAAYKKICAQSNELVEKLPIVIYFPK